ncbi:COX15/CtaA family protein [Aneurinibacillus sp. UBA3580]|jgi:cytochrome c oxidase assembly protein subunit 15|uniref:COX15/CtaA family protein n=1 Tax=Aneurinibacillus sp. UBA3580 TaxID=1946041 RepID=UPI00257B9D87|nr:COX15/CtaA family protein [Aneurinibacillus sp. UBA3580]
MGYRLPFVTTIATFLLLIAGALVVGFDAGLACSDWPLCNGHIIPPLEGKIIIEYTHRLLSTGIGFLMLANLYFAWRKRKESPIVLKLVLLSFVLLLFVAVLGGINVLKKLPPGFTAMDTSFAILLFSTFVVLTGVTLANFRKKQGEFREDRQVRAMFKPALIAAIAIYIEYVLGAFIKHSDAGQVWVNGKINLLNNIISTPAIATTLMYVHVFATLLIVFSSLWLYFYARLRKVMKNQAVTLLILLALQPITGFITVVAHLAVITNVIHMAIAALMMALAVFMVVEAKLGANLLLTADKDSKVVSGSKQSAVNLG